MATFSESVIYLRATVNNKHFIEEWVEDVLGLISEFDYVFVIKTKKIEKKWNLSGIYRTISLCL